jgi:hypothetical protein
MRRDFDQKVSQEEALRRIPKAHSGHKHQGRPGPGHVARAQESKRRHVQAVNAARRKKYLDGVRAYWRGEKDTLP